MRRKKNQYIPRYESLWKFVRGDIESIRTITSATSADAGILWVLIPELFDLNAIYVLERKSKNNFIVRTCWQRGYISEPTIKLEDCKELLESSFSKKGGSSHKFVG